MIINCVIMRKCPIFLKKIFPTVGEGKKGGSESV